MIFEGMTEREYAAMDGLSYRYQLAYYLKEYKKLTFYEIGKRIPNERARGGVSRMRAMQLYNRAKNAIRLAHYD